MSICPRTRDEERLLQHALGFVHIRAGENDRLENLEDRCEKASFYRPGLVDGEQGCDSAC